MKRSVEIALAARRPEALGIKIEYPVAGRKARPRVFLDGQYLLHESKGHPFWRVWKVRHFLAFFSFSARKERRVAVGSSSERPQNRLGFVAGLRRIANALARAALCAATSATVSDPPREAETGARARA